MPSLDDLLTAAVDGVGGATRPGQVEMAHAVEQAIESGEHLLVQAGTGTGKSLAYLVPAVAHARQSGRPAVVATATLALQAQIVDRDMPRLADALEGPLGHRPTYALVKGRRNYVCRHKLDGGFPDDESSLLDVGEVDAAAGRLGREVVRLREWAAESESGDRDELVPGVSERAWRQVSVSAQECLGSRCPELAECFVERSRQAAKDVDIIVTNHSFMAIDAFEGRHLLPPHDVLVVDEIGIPEFLRVFPKVFKGAHTSHPRVSVRRARSVRLDAAGIVAYADGERLFLLPLDVEVVPGAVQILL